MLDPILDRLYLSSGDTRHGRLPLVSALDTLNDFQQGILVGVAEVGHRVPILAPIFCVGTSRDTVQSALHQSSREERHGLANVYQDRARDHRRIEPDLVFRYLAGVLWRSHLQASDLVLKENRDDALIGVRRQSNGRVVSLLQGRVVDQSERRVRRAFMLVDFRKPVSCQTQPDPQASKKPNGNLLVRLGHELLNFRVESPQRRWHRLVVRLVFPDHKDLLAILRGHNILGSVLVHVLLRPGLCVVACIVDTVPRCGGLFFERRCGEECLADVEHAINLVLFETVVLQVQKTPCLADLLDFLRQTRQICVESRKVDNGDVFWPKAPHVCC